MKKTLSIVLAIMLMIMAIPFSVFADEYYDIDFTKTLSLDTAYSGTIDATDPYIGTRYFSGYAKGFTVSLEGGKSYKISATVSDPNAYYIDRMVAVLPSSLTTSFADDCLVHSIGAYVQPGTTVTAQCIVDIPETGNYKVLVWGYCENSSYHNITGGSLTVSAHEYTRKIKDIYTVQDLLDAYAAINGGEDIDVLNFMANIDMSSTDWTSFPEISNMTVKGNNFTITGLNNPLFSVVGLLEASDLTFDSFNYTSTSGAESVGALVGGAEEAIISNCSVSGSINISGGYADYIGGLIGYVEEESSITDCSSDITITIDAGGNFAGYIGGLIGYVDYATIFDNCAAEGSITITDVANTAGDIGGFAGYFEDWEACNNCSADVDITITTSGTEAEVYSIGGFTGYIDEACCFSNCWSAGSVNIEGKNDCCYYIGGFNGCSDCCGNTHCYNCYSITDVKGGNEFVGSFFGSAYYDDTFKNCYAAGDVTFVGTSGTEYGPYNGLFIGGTAYADEITCENCFVKKDAEAPKILDDDGNGIDPFDGITEVDFSDSTAIENMTKALNDGRDAYLDEYNGFLEDYLEFDTIEKFFAWGKINEKDGPIFANRTVRFLDENGNEILVLDSLYDGDDFSSLAPAVPAKEGFTGKWNTNFIVDGDMDIYAVYEKNGNNSDPGNNDPGNNNNNNNNNKHQEDVPTSPETGNSDIILMVLSVLLIVNMGLIVKTRANKAK